MINGLDASEKVAFQLDGHRPRFHLHHMVHRSHAAPWCCELPCTFERC
jgi:hypothetical protein